MPANKEIRIVDESGIYSTAGKDIVIMGGYNVILVNPDQDDHWTVLYTPKTKAEAKEFVRRLAIEMAHTATGMIFLKIIIEGIKEKKRNDRVVVGE